MASPLTILAQTTPNTASGVLQDGVSANFLVGVVSGLVATLLTVGFRRFWVSVVAPWIEELLYKDAKIEGTWYSVFPELEYSRYDVVTLSRRGHSITARMTCFAGIDSGQTYVISGSFRNLILSASYETENRQGLDRGSLTLMLTENGAKLVGHIACYTDFSHKIGSSSVTFYRSKEKFERDHKVRIQQVEAVMAKTEAQTEQKAASTAKTNPNQEKEANQPPAKLDAPATPPPPAQKRQ